MYVYMNKKEIYRKLTYPINDIENDYKNYYYNYLFYRWFSRKNM